MALSHRFGILQSLGLTHEDDETCEEYRLLQSLIGKNTLFPCPSNIPVLSDSGDNEVFGQSDIEEEKVDPLWRVEFQNILRKCKQRSGSINKEGLFYVGRRNGDDTDSQRHLEDKSCYGDLNEKCILDENEEYGQKYFNADKMIENKSVSFVNDSNKKNVKADDLKNISDDNEIYVRKLALSPDKIRPKFQISKGELINCDEKANEDVINNKSLNIKCSTELNSSESVKENEDFFNEKQLTNQTKQVIVTDKVAQKDRKFKISNDSTKTTKKVKPVVKVIPSTCFPLDELLPKTTMPENQNQSKPLVITDKTNDKAMDNFYTSNLHPYNSNMHSFISPVQGNDSVFHGEVFDSPVVEDFEPFSVNRSDSVDYDASSLNHHESTESLDAIQAIGSDKVDTNTSRNASLENFSFIIDALHEGNDSFVEQLQNVLSKQNRYRPDDQQKPSLNGGNSGENMEDNPFQSGRFHRYSAGSAENLHFNDTEGNGQVDTKRDDENNLEESLLQRKEDDQSKKLFHLFVDQCSQLVKTDEDRKMLASLVKLLKRESGSELFSTTGFTPPPTPSHQNTCDRIVTSTSKNEAEVELFEGRTLLKGGVPPRHIPKTAIIKTGNDRPMDPRPISTMLSKSKPRPLPLPKFIYEIHDSAVIQRILTLDWDCKRSLFLDDNNELNKDSDLISAYNPSKDLQNLCARSSDDKVCRVQSTVKGNTNYDELERGIKEDSLDKTTPLKDESRKAYQGNGKEPEEAFQLGNSVYGRCKANDERGNFDEKTNLKSLTDKIGDIIQDTFNKSAKRGLFCDLTGSENQRSIKRNIEFKNENQSIPKDFALDSCNNKAPFIIFESSNSYDFKSLVKTDSFLGSLDKLPFSTLIENNETSPPSDSNNNCDSDVYVKQDALPESDNNSQSKQQNSLLVDNDTTESCKNQSTLNKGASHSNPVLLSDTICKDVSESNEHLNSYDKNSDQSIQVHLSNANGQVDIRPIGVYVDSDVVVSNTSGKTGKKSESSNIPDDVREEGEVTPDLEDVIVLSDDDDDTGNLVSVNDKDSIGNRNSTSKSTKENELTKTSNNDNRKTKKVKEIEKKMKVTINKIRIGNHEIFANKAKIKTDISMKENSVKLDELWKNSENCVDYMRNKPEDIRQDARNEARHKSDEKSHNESTNRKRKITNTGVRISYDFEYQNEPDSSVILDGKRKKREESDEAIKLPHYTKPKLIRERRRHSSCSSVESIKLDDQRRESSNHRHRQKSTVSYTRSSNEVRSSTPSLSRSRSNSSDKSRYSNNPSSSNTDKSKHSKSLSHSTTEKSRHSSSQNHSNTNILGHSRSLSHSSTSKSKYSSSHSNSNTDKSRHSSSQSNYNTNKSKDSSNQSSSSTEKSRNSSSHSLSRSESSAGHRKRHHTVHESGQSATEKRSRLETLGAIRSKRRHSDDHKNFHTSSQFNEKKSSDVKRSSLLYDDILSPEYAQNTDSGIFSSLTEQSKAEHSQIISKAEDYEDILSPENSCLSDEMLSEEYQRLFGKNRDSDLTNAEGNPGKPLQKSLFSKVLPNKILSKSLEDDMKFLESYKQKVQKKETTTGAAGDSKSEKCLDFKQELEDRKFLQMCKKRKEEKAKLSFEQRMRDYKKV